jgi:hypothetical protein
MQQSPSRLYQEREKRVNDAVQLKIPDRIPILGMFGHFYTKYTDITCRELTYDRDKLYKLG